MAIAKKMLENLGYRVLSATSPSQAQALAANYQEKIHLLITDVIMPGMNGKELSEQLLALHPELEVLYMSGYTANTIVDHGIPDQGVRFIAKPFSLKDLSKQVQKALGNTN